MSIFGNIVDAIRTLMGGRLTYSEMADVLDKLALENPEDLDWRNSIVDLLKLVDIDSSLANRKALAKELNYNRALDGSAEMNIALHGLVMQKLAEHGGTAPDSLKD